MGGIDVTDANGWAEACSAAFVPLRVRSTDPRFHASLQQRVLSPEVSLTQVSSGASEVYRSARVIAQHPRDDVLISLHRSGTGTVTQHGRQAKLRTGSAAMYDASSAYTLSFPGAISEVVLQMPRRCIPGTGHAFTDLTARPLPDGGALRALTALATSITPADPHHNPLEDAAVADSMVALLTALVSSDVPVTSPSHDSEVLQTTVRRFIDDHLADPDLCPELVAHAHHISLRLLQKLFAQDGDSPAAYIRRHRLESARRLLLSGKPVGRTALVTGFNDPDTFCRAFKREFNVTPSSVVPHVD